MRSMWDADSDRDYYEQFDQAEPEPFTEPEPDTPEDGLCVTGHLIVCGAPSAKTMVAHMIEHMKRCPVCRGEEEGSPELPELQPITRKVARVQIPEWDEVA